MSKPALGKGLGALIAKKNDLPAALSGKVDGESVIQALVSEIATCPFQPRRHFNEQQIAELAESIRERGLVQPLVVRKVDGKYELIAGERRLRAVKKLGMKQVKVVLFEATDQEVAEIALIENLQREDLTPLEEAEQYRLLQHKFGMKQEVIAKHVGKSRAVVANMVRLLDLVADVRDMLENNKITVGHAKVLLQLKDSDQQLQAANRVERQGLTVRQTEQLVRSILNPAPAPEPAPAPALPAPVAKACKQLARNLGAEVSISMKGKSGGVIQIPYAGQEDLERLLQAMGISAKL
ncbi:MAG: ParB/RepB/Spo0J family partition protein [Akkermansia sp.]|nr:ParB/RepB/Spo0J family partition protein [Akkermansia sp.]